MSKFNINELMQVRRYSPEGEEKENIYYEASTIYSMLAHNPTNASVNMAKRIAANICNQWREDK